MDFLSIQLTSLAVISLKHTKKYDFMLNSFLSS